MNMFILNKYDIMINISKVDNGVLIEIDDMKNLHPASSLSTHVTKGSDNITIRYKASRKNAYSFNYKSLTSPTASTVEEAQSLISKILE